MQTQFCGGDLDACIQTTMVHAVIIKYSGPRAQLCDGIIAYNVYVDHKAKSRYAWYCGASVVTETYSFVTFTASWWLCRFILATVDRHILAGDIPNVLFRLSERVT